MACGSKAEQCRAEHIALELRGAGQDGTDWEARCPLCGHGGFRISTAKVRSYRHVWTCNCKRCRCGDPAALRSALLKLGITPGCLGVYAMDLKPAADPIAAAALREAVDLILSWPGLDPSEMRLILAEARGDKIPDDYSGLAKYGQSIGISRAHSFRMAAKLCRPPDASSSPEGGVVDT